MPSLLLALTLSLVASSASADHNLGLHQRHSNTRHRGLARSLPRTEKRQANGLDANPVLGGYKIVGDSGVSAQMMFLGTENTVFILDSECCIFALFGVDSYYLPAVGCDTSGAPLTPLRA
jgi:hypothetical protein